MTLLIVGMIATCVILLSYGPNQRPAAPVARHKKFYLSIPISVLLSTALRLMSTAAH